MHSKLVNNVILRDSSITQQDNFLLDGSLGLSKRDKTRLASVGILGKERVPGVGKLGWHGNFGTGFERKSRVRVF